MNRQLVSALALMCLASACGGGEPETPAAEAHTDAPAAAAPDPTMLPTPQQNAVAATSVTCDGQPYKVAFNDFSATLTYDDGTTQELPVQPPTADSEPGVTVYTDNNISFSKSGGGEKPETIRFARGRLAWQDCALTTT